MLTITIQVNAPDGSAQMVKESLAMFLERFGDCKVVEVKEELPRQMDLHNYTGNYPNER